MNKVAIVKHISRGYFLLALVVSFLHLIHAAHKGGLTWEAWLVPFMVDGIAVMGVALRGEEFAKRTRKIGFRTQVVAGALSLAGNVYAAHNMGGMLLGVAVVLLFVFAEWLTDQIESAEVEAAREAAELAAQAKAAAIAKGQATRKRKAAEAAKVVRGAERITKAAVKRS